MLTDMILILFCLMRGLLCIKTCITSRV